MGWWRGLAVPLASVLLDPVGTGLVPVLSFIPWEILAELLEDVLWDGAVSVWVWVPLQVGYIFGVAMVLQMIPGSTPVAGDCKPWGS